MDEIKYHPLITDGKEMIPMFCTPNEKNVANNAAYLEEIVSGHYRLYTKNEISRSDAIELLVHCPRCGAIMNPISSQINNHKHALYRCNKCN